MLASAGVLLTVLLQTTPTANRPLIRVRFVISGSHIHLRSCTLFHRVNAKRVTVTKAWQLLVSLDRAGNPLKARVTGTMCLHLHHTCTARIAHLVALRAICRSWTCMRIMRWPSFPSSVVLHNSSIRTSNALGSDKVVQSLHSGVARALRASMPAISLVLGSNRPWSAPTSRSMDEPHTSHNIS